MLNPMDMTDNRVLVTGASSGIGRAVCITLSQLGARVAMIARREEQLKETYDMLEGDGHTYFLFDLEQLDGIEALMKTVKMKFGKLDGFVHCAGINFVRPLNMLKLEALKRAMTVNAMSFIESMRSFGKKSISNDQASAVAISSIATTAPESGMTGYITSKAAIEGAVRSIAVELGKMRGIRVNAVCPGLTDTDMYQNAKKIWESDRYETNLKRQFLGIAQPKEISMLIAFLLSSAASQITGRSIVIDGGYTLS